MSRIEDADWEDCFVEPRRNPEMERYLRKHIGVAPAAARYYASSPWVAHSIPYFHARTGATLHLDNELDEKIALVVSRDNSCRYCFASIRVLMRMVGVSEERVRRLEQDLSSAELTPAEEAALVFVRRLSRFDPPISKSDVEPLLRAGFDAPTIAEIAVAAAYMCAANRLNTLPAIPTEAVEALPDRLLMRLVRPLAGLAVRIRGRRGRPVELTVEERAGPFSYLVDALNGLPFGRAVRRTVDEAWESPVVPPRTRALVFAVIARALGAPHAEAEALRLLDAEGFARSDADSVLAHLASPALDAHETACVPWARETVRYANAPIQRSSRKLFEVVGQDRFMELVGIASLANMLARLDFLGDGIA